MLQGPGRLSPAAREAIVAGRGDPEGMQPLLDKARRDAYRVTDEDVAALRGRYDDDELFEAIVCASLGAALVRLRAGLGALEEA